MLLLGNHGGSCWDVKVSLVTLCGWKLLLTTVDETGKHGTNNLLAFTFISRKIFLIIELCRSTKEQHARTHARTPAHTHQHTHTHFNADTQSHKQKGQKDRPKQPGCLCVALLCFAVAVAAGHQQHRMGPAVFLFSD